jgi:hypothetical protein
VEETPSATSARWRMGSDTTFWSRDESSHATAAAPIMITKMVPA